MPYRVRPMCHEDLSQVTDIDQEAFPTMWPPANYRRELGTRLAHYIVAHEVVSDEGSPVTVTGRVRNIVGFAGFWMMANEAHITNIAVRKSHRRRGIGELLLISMIELALELGANLLTLEVRASNIAAQGLYRKYGLNQLHIRRGYYTDNRENALVLAVDDITSADFRQHLKQLKQAHARRWR
ncbi:MAG: ribosomal protein S18-alanine N-acetyltransferase [Dehalococcoidales bacterium]|nr:ribosomal protein S18-alanine N-acetyltransferase [Dehalococcoidales bacterium]